MCAEANYHGKTASAWWGLDTAGTVAALAQLDNVIEWNVSLAGGSAESSVMHATQRGKTREPGFKGGTATVICNLPSGDTVISEGDEGSLELLRDLTNASKGYAFGVAGAAGKGAICTGVDLGVDKDGIETVTYTFQSTGAISSTVTKGSA